MTLNSLVTLEMRGMFGSHVENQNRTPDELKKIEYIIVHHSGTSYGNVEVFRRVHREERGWYDIGYHFVICNGNGGEDGEVQVGRSLKYVGAHCIPHNKDSIGVCMVGNFNNNMPTRKQMLGLIKLVANLCKQYNIPPKNVLGHNETWNTECPGRNVDMKEIREQVAKRLAFDYIGHWAEGDIDWVIEEKLMNPDSSGKFYPDKPITRAQLATVLRRLYDKLISSR